MFIPRKPFHSLVCAALAALLPAVAGPALMTAQSTSDTANELAAVPLPEPTVYALPLAEDRGQADLEQTLKRLGTAASVLCIVAHPDDEDGALLTYLSRGLGMRVTLMTLTRGEGGQNAMSAEEDDALGLLRTNELLKADEYYGVRQLWGTEADFGFSKTQEESFARWGHDRVLYDAVLAVRMVRPQVIIASFVGGVSDGHGQHQVSGEIAQEAFKEAGDPNVFPEQLKNGLQPWQPLAAYSRAPFAQVTSKGIFDYATGKWAPAKFHNYVTGEWTDGPPSADVGFPVGTWDPVLGRTYVQIAREGWGMQKSQYGGASPSLDEPESSRYHLWAAAPEAVGGAKGAGDGSFFENPKVRIDTSVAGLARLAGDAPPAWLNQGLREIEDGVSNYRGDCHDLTTVDCARKLAPVYQLTLDLYARVKASDLNEAAKYGLTFELGEKIDQFQRALKDMLGLDMVAFTTRSGEGQGGSGRGGTADETPRSVSPGEAFAVRVHTAKASPDAQLKKVWLESSDGGPWQAADAGGPIDAEAAEKVTADRLVHVTVPEDAKPTEPYFTRPSIEQPYYDSSDPTLRLESFAPWPLAAWAQFTFQNVPIRVGMVVQTLERVTGPGGVYEPLVVTPKIGVDVQPEARILPLNGSALPVKVTVRALGAADGTVELKLPQGWRSEPASRTFKLKAAGQSDALEFSVTAPKVGAGTYTVQAVAHVGGQDYQTGWRSVGYEGLLPYNLYRPAALEARKVDVKVAPGLKVGYVMGTGDTVPAFIEELGLEPHLLTDEELTTGDLSQWNVIVIGIRAYSTRPGLSLAQPRLDAYVEHGGTMVVQYQSATFPAPLPLAMGRTPERVVDETAPVKLLAPDDPLLKWPNKIGAADFDGWIEERGHSFLDSWDPGYTALTETADAGQDPQRGGLLVAHPGKGTYIYVAYALYRQFPELVPGSYRILANLLSAGKETKSKQ